MIPATAYAAAGAILAALITSGISFVNLVISKDQKTSEFRQAWIDALRQDLSEMIGHIFRISALCDYYIDLHNDDKDKAINELVKDVGKDIATVSMLYHRILLRLNPVDDKSVIDSVTVLHDMLSSIETNMVDQDKIDNESQKLIDFAQTLLKKEWKRVKRGEPAFFITKYFFLVVVPLVVLLCIFNKSTIYQYLNISNYNNSGVVTATEPLKDTQTGDKGTGGYKKNSR